MERRQSSPGGSRGIGKAVARELASEGVEVALVARTLEPLETAARELETMAGSRVLAITCDTAFDDSVRAMVSVAAERLDGIDLLVNCAARTGGQAPPRLPEMYDEMFWSDINVKVMGYLRCIREVVPHMAVRGGGRIINLSGQAARSTGTMVTCVRNVAVAAMTKNLADELSPQGISLVVVHPGTTRTERTADLLRTRAAERGVGESLVEQEMSRANLVGRLIDAREVASVVTFLCSSKSVAIRGDAIWAGGGVRGPIIY